MKKTALLLSLFALAPLVAARAEDPATNAPPASPEELIATARRCLDGLPDELDFARGVELLREAAAAGSAEAVVRLGACSDEGTGVPRDVPRALELYREAAGKGCDLGEIAVAMYRLRGLAEEPDAHEAFRRLSALGKAGDPFARLALAQCRAFGIGGVPRDPEKAARHASRAAEAFRPGAEAGDTEKQQGLAVALFAAGGFSRDGFGKAEPWFEAAAARGDPGSNEWLLKFAIQSREFGVDPAKRRLWAERAQTVFEARAAQGAPRAMLALGRIERHGLVGAPDAEAAVAWFRRAADAGHPEALYELGRAYETGDGVPRDEARARDFLGRSAEQRQPEALLRLARLDLAAGDAAAARRRLREAAKLSAWPARDVLDGLERDRRVGPAWARVLLDTIFEGADHPEAKIDWSSPEGAAMLSLRLKAVQGDAGSQLELGDRYWRGDGAPRDRAVAVEWIRRAAEAGHAPAQNRLGVCLSRCDSTKESRREAALWFRKAAEQGVAEARENLSFFRWTAPAAIAQSYVDLCVEREAAPPAEPADRSPAARDRAILERAAARPADLAARVRAELLVPHEFGPDLAAPWGPQARGALRFLADELVAGTILRMPDAEGWGLFYDRTVRDGADDPALRWGSVVGQLKWNWTDEAREQLDALEARLEESGATLFQRMLAAQARALLDPDEANARAFLDAADAWTATLDPAIPADDVRTLLRGLGYSKARLPDAKRLFAPSLATRTEKDLVCRGASKAVRAAAVAAAEEAERRRTAAEDVGDFGLPPRAEGAEDESRAEIDFEPADRLEFREFDDERKMDELHERWRIVVEERKMEALLQSRVRVIRGILSGKEPDAEGTPEEAGREDVRDEKFPLRDRIKTVPESERDSFLEDAWVEYCAEDRRLQASICILKGKLMATPGRLDSGEDPAEAEPHAESAEGAESGSPAGGAGERSEPEGVPHAESAGNAE